LQSRLAFLQRLKKKYGPTLAQVINCRMQTEEKLRRTESSDEELQGLDQNLKELDGRIRQQAAELTQHRKELAQQLQKLIAERLAHLGMPHVVFSIASEERECHPHGVDHIEFRFSANLGEPQRSLREIASGGELSRVMLSIKTVLAETDDVQTLVFDEVDAGIGGAVAIAVGDQMHELAKSRQVVAITHLASIAARADHQLVVSKEVLEGRTYTRINASIGETRVLEIARMLSGDTRQDAAIAHARQLLAVNS
jgi:DNA repair protein RecN (Recombination protein N)